MFLTRGNFRATLNTAFFPRSYRPAVKQLVLVFQWIVKRETYTQKNCTNLLVSFYFNSKYLDTNMSDL